MKTILTELSPLKVYDFPSVALLHHLFLVEILDLDSVVY